MNKNGSACRSHTSYLAFKRLSVMLINLKKKKKRSTGYSVPTSFSLISLSISFFPGCNNNNNSRSSTCMLCLVLFFFGNFPISVASEIRDSLAASTVSERLTERINVLLFLTITSGLRCLPSRPEGKPEKHTSSL